MINVPAWSDLGAELAEDVTETWDNMLMRLMTYHRYYSGEVFLDYGTEDRSTNEQDSDPLFPAGINLAKIMCMAHADALMGEWQETPIQFNTRHNETPDEDQKKAISLVQAILENSSAGPLFWELDIDRNIFGAAAFRVEFKPGQWPFVKWKRIQRDAFFPIWNPEDPDELLECYVVTRMNRVQAKSLFMLSDRDMDNYLSREIVYHTIHWTRYQHASWLDQRSLLPYQPNPYHVVPFVLIPRLRTTSYWGDSLVEDIMAIQDELNMRAGDVSDIIDYNASPVKWGRDLPRAFEVNNFPLSANALWDLGRSHGDFKPEVGILEADANLLPSAKDHMELLHEMARLVSGTPAIAYGSDQGGGQRSADTLEIRLRPFVASIRRSRSYFYVGMKQALFITQKILKQKGLTDMPRRAVEKLTTLSPTFAPVLPRDRNALVDEIVKLSSVRPPQISMQTSQELLGRGQGEVARIEEMLYDEELWARLLAIGLMKGLSGTNNDQGDISDG
jgi:hypothetical protein